MKKILMAFISAFALLFALVACDKQNEEPKEPIIETLATPEITADGTIVSWNAIENAGYYIVYVNGEKQPSQTKTSFELEASDYGDYLIRVKALKDSNDGTAIASELSNTVTISIYDSYLPEFNVVNDEKAKTLSWDKVDKANTYTIYVNGEEKTTITEAKKKYSYSYAEIEKLGSYNFKIVARSNKASYGPSTTEVLVKIEAQPLDTPVTHLNTNVLTWDANPYAKEYVVEVNHVEYRQTECYYNVPETTGDSINQIRVKAITNSEMYSDSEWTDIIELKISKNGYLEKTTGDYTKYENTSAYVQVTNAQELLQALKNAKYDYTSTATQVLENKGYVERKNVRKGGEDRWSSAIEKGLFIKNADGTFTKIEEGTPLTDSRYTDDMTYYEDSPLSPVSYTQKLNKEGTVHVIEIMNNIDLGWNVLSDEAKAVGNAKSFESKNASSFTLSDMYKTYGISQITISNCYDLLIYSKNGAKLTHGGFKLESSQNVCIRNLAFDELWQWEDSSNKEASLAIGDMDAFGWAYFKINYCDEIWIDHCSFGKSYDGTIDIANPTYDTIGTLFRAPYNSNGSSDCHISWCTFNENAADENGYVYQMMQAVEADYQAGLGNYQYYKALRDAGYTFEEIFYGIAAPHKKAFLMCDGTDPNYADNKDYNENLNISIAFCKFFDIEDRIPKVRSANAYLYGNVVDNSRYYTYLQAIKGKEVNGVTITAKEVVTSVNSKWKCAGVSHGVLVSQDGSAYVYGCIFKGINELLTNNDYGKGGIIVENTRYIVGNVDYTGSTSDENNEFLKHTAGTISPEYFQWNNETHSIPFYVESIDLASLEGLLTICGTASETIPTIGSGYYLKNPYTL